MTLHHVVQICRYIIVEDVGCWPIMHPSLVKIPMVVMWPILLASISFIYAGATIRAFFKTRRQFSRILSDSGDNLSMSRYFRLMALAGTEMVFSLPLSLYPLIHGLIIDPPPAWVSWDDTHQYIHEVWTYSHEEILGIPGEQTAFDINRWAIPGCAFLFFMFFGLSGEAMRQYKRLFWRAVAPFGLMPPAPRPQHQTNNWSRRLAARATTSNHDLTTFPSGACAGDSDADKQTPNHATRLDNAPDAQSQHTAKAEIEDLESQK
ncbi:a-factor receptor [Ceratobasidium sp. 395]|nr:a-factor receptor [Ceratobasidium sp. 395]